ncbi:MAG: hypothetical protein KAT29_02420 [Anaerolineales bacterium]|nr:hypothetical protein [Anaerolineales bacterium]
MLMKLSANFRRLSTGWVTLLGLLVVVVFSITVLPSQTAQADRNASQIGVPDLSFYYSAEQLYEMAEGYGSEGRSAYIRARFTFDLIWPLVYGFFLVTSMSWLSGKVLQDGSRWEMANLLPLAGVLFDYLENISTSLVMLRYPQDTWLAANLAGIFTALKWVSIGASFVTLVIFLVGAIWKWLKKR